MTKIKVKKENKNKKEELGVMDERKMGEILIAQNYVDQDDMIKAEEYAKQHNASALDFLVDQQIVTVDLIGQAVAEYYKVPYADLNTNQPNKDQILKIPEVVGKKFRSVLYQEDEKGIVVATDNPSQSGLLTALKKIFKNKKISIAYSLPIDIDSVLINYKKSLETRFAKIINSQGKVAPQILDEIIDDALIFNASDIHLEPQEEIVLVRFRVDGVLHEAGKISREYYENIVNRIKVQAKLRTDDHFSAQDGAIRYQKGGDGRKATDIRVSITPTLDGEKVVMRLLSEYVRNFTLGSVGFSQGDQEIIEEVSRKPFGMILTVGPTGSGKTTTLYSLIKNINNSEINIATIEDPVEYRVVGINQIQVNSQTNLTFAKGLRSIVRQDPDVILVGEIRDEETAEIAINAALTGHLLFSTFHSNDAAATIPRLLDMGSEPFLLASTLELIVAQRLVRKNCDRCAVSYSVNKNDLKKLNFSVEKFFKNGTITLYRGKGCDGCNHTGFRGRIAVFEMIRMTPEMQDLVLKNPSSKQIWELAKKQGSHSMFEDGMEKVKNGITTIEELLRVTSPYS